MLQIDAGIWCDTKHDILKIIFHFYVGADTGALSCEVTLDGECSGPAKFSGMCHLNNRYIGEIIKLETSSDPLFKSVRIIYANIQTAHHKGVFTLTETETDTETHKKACIYLCGVVHTAQRNQMLLGIVAILSAPVSASASVNVS